MRLMIVGSDKVFAIENFYIRHISETGTPLQIFPAQSIFYDFYENKIFNKIIFRFGLSRIYGQINRAFRDAVEKFKPDVIWVFKGMEIFPDTLSWAKKRGIKLAEYNPDNPFIFTGRGSGNQNVTDSLALYDLHFTYNLEIKLQLEQRFGKEVVYLPFGYEINDELYELCAQQMEVVKTCFLGNPDKVRAAFITSIAEKGIAIDVYGNNWRRFLDHKNIALFPPVYGENLWKTLRRYRVQLNLLRIHNEDAHNMRSFEVPGIGGIMVAPTTTDHRHLFESGKEVFLYSDADECVSLIRKLLTLSAQEALKIREAAHQRSVDSGYSYRHRGLQALIALKKLHE
jgi:spore maturation protein CgeB